MSEGHEVTVCLQFVKGKFSNPRSLDAIYDFEEILVEVIEIHDCGLYDGHEFAEGPEETSICFFFNGPDADAICEAIVPYLSNLPILPGSYILKRYGNAGAPEEQILLA